MIEDMQLRNLSTETQRAYLHYITGLARFYQTSPEHLSLEELREYQLYLINERQYSAESVNHFVVSAKFLYNVTLETPWSEDALPRCRVPHKLPVVLSATEVSEFFQHVSTIRYRAALMTAYGAGLRVSEVVALQIGDIDSQRGLIRVRQGKGKKDLSGDPADRFHGQVDPADNRGDALVEFTPRLGPAGAVPKCQGFEIEFQHGEHLAELVVDFP